MKEWESLDVQPDADKYQKSANHKNFIVKANHLCEILKFFPWFWHQVNKHVHTENAYKCIYKKKRE